MRFPHQLRAAAVLLPLVVTLACARHRTPPHDPERVAVTGKPARYPEMLRTAGVEGRVELLVAVDADGRAMWNSTRVIASTHELFKSQVRQVLPTWWFAPAKTRGTRRIPVTVTFVIVDSTALVRCERTGHPVLRSCGVRSVIREVRSH